MRSTSHCMNCGSPKAQGEYLNDYCGTCFSAKEGAAAAAAAEGKDPNEARRRALAERAHTAHRNFTDPRTIDRHTVWLEGNRPATPEVPQS